MKKALSLILVLAMLLSFMPCAFAIESENADEYNSLRLPVRNEVKEEGTVEEEQEMPMMFSSRPMTLSENVTENTDASSGGSSSGGGGGGGGSAVVVPSPVVPEETSTVIRATIDSPRNEPIAKGWDCRIEDIVSLLEEDIADTIYNLLYDMCFGGIYFTYENSETKEVLYTNSRLYRETDDGVYELIIPVPKELENGEYNVEAHYITEPWMIYEIGYTEFVLSFPITVCEIPEEEKGANFDESELWSLNDIAAFVDETVSVCEYDNEEGFFTLENKLPVETSMTGFAVDKDGNVFGLDAYCKWNGEAVVFDAGHLPLGEYDCYFAILGWDEELEEYENTLFGPAKLVVDEIAFYDDFYKFSNSGRYDENGVWVGVDIGPTATEKIPVEYQDIIEELTVSLSFTNEQGSNVKTMSGLYVDWLRIFDNSLKQTATLDFLVEYADITPGKYDVEVTLCGPDEEILLGSAEMLIIEDPVIVDIGIWNYGYTLTPATESFYVGVTLDEYFLGYDKYNINMLDAQGNIVANTVSKNLGELRYYGGSTLLYKLEVTEPLSMEESYTLEIQAEKPMQVYSDCDEVYIAVEDHALIAYATISGDAVTVYTENLPAGEYIVQDSSSTRLPIEINENGIGTFIPVQLYEGYNHFTLWTTEGYIDDFNVCKDYYDYSDKESYLRMEPYWIPEGATEITEVSLYTEDNGYTEEDIEYIHFIQEETTNDGDLQKTVIAQLKNFTTEVITEEGTDSANMKEQYSKLVIIGDIVAEEGKSFIAGYTDIELKFKDGTVCNGDIGVESSEAIAYDGYGTRNKRIHYGGYIDEIPDFYVDYIISGNKLCYVLDRTNISEAEMYLYKYDENGNRTQVGETLKINSSPEYCTKEHGVYYTYDIEFPTELEENTVYYMQIRTPDGNSVCSFGNFVYTTEPVVRANVWEDYDRAEIYVEHLNMGNNPEFAFKAVSEDEKVYDIPSIKSYVYRNDVSYSADFNDIPNGEYTIEVYCDGEEVENISNESFYWVKKTVPTINYIDYDKKGQLLIYGALLNTATDGYVEAYREVTIDRTDITKLEYAGRLPIDKPFNSRYLVVSSETLKEIETGEYVFAVVLDGEIIGSEWAYIVGKEPEYSATVVLNGGLRYTNADSVELDITSNGYKWMKVAFSEEELAETAYEAICKERTISIADKNGEITVYVQLANEEATKTETKALALVIDRDEPEITEAVIPESLSMWGNAELSFVSDEVLKNAFLFVGTANEQQEVEGRNFVFSYVGNEGGLYTYKCNVYVGSQYEDISSLDAQIVAYDKAGNNTSSSIQKITIKQPKDISGTVKFGDSPVYGASVYLYDKEDNYVSYDYTDSDGKYKFDNVSDGGYTIKVYRNGYAESSVSISEEDFLENEIVKDIVLTSVYTNNSTVTVNVKDAAQNPKNDITVQIYNWNTGTNRTEKTDAAGQVTFENICYKEGGTSYSIYTYDNNGYSDYEYLDVNEPTETVDFTYPIKATISGVVKHNNEPLADVEILVKDKSGYSTYEYTKTNENGEFTAEVYLNDGNRAFTLTTSEGLLYSGSTTVTFEENETEKNDVVIEVSGNASVRGYVKDANGNAITDFKQVRFYNRGGYEYIADIDETGYFETPAFLDGTYTFYLSDYYNKNYTYSSCSQSVTITEEDLQAGYKEITFTPEKYRASKFSTGSNGISASADIIAKGDYVTINVKCQNDGTRTINSVSLNAEIPEGVTATTDTNTTQSGNIVSKNAGTMKADDTANMTFTIDTDDYEDGVISIPAYVMADGTKYSLGNLTIKIVSATISAPSTVKKGEAFKVTGEAIKGSAVKIINYNTKEVLAVTDCQGKWYSAEITLNEIGTVTLAAKVTKDDITAYSIATDVVVEEKPVTVNDIIITANGKEYKKNSLYDYPVFYVIVYSEMVGPQLNAKVKFDNMPADATVKYTLTNQEVDNVQLDGEYYNGTIPRWKGSASNKLYATVTDNESGKEYEFIIADIIILIDPSGHVTDAETGEPIVDAEVRIEQYNNNTGEWSMWDAEPSGQQNPMYTDENGHYGWDVPEGTYRIIVSKDGYETKTVERYDSRDHGDNSEITVLPVRTDVDITLVNARTVELDEASTASVAGGKVKFVFTRPVDPATVTEDNFKVLKSDGTEVEGSIVLAENNTVALFKPATAMTNGDYKLSVANIKDGSNNIIPAEEIPFEKTTDASALAAPAVAYNTDGTITITFAKGKTPVNSEEIVVKNGASVVNGTLRESANVITFIPDAALTAGTTYKVVVSDAIRTAENEYLAASFEQNVTVPGGSTPPGDNDNDGPAGGGGGGGSSISKPSASVAEGIVEKGTKVELTTGSKNGKIYYTLDGSEPTKDSTLYTEPIVINENTCIKAIAVNGTMESSVITLNYNVKGADKTKFADIANYAWAQDAISALSEKGIIKGVSDSQFAPANNIKRADYMLLLVRMLGLEAEVTENFADVSKDSYYYEALGVAKKLGLSTGVGDNKFNPEASITRQDMFVLAYRILEMQNVEMDSADDTAINAFKDYSNISDYAKDALAKLVKNELVKGSDNSINPIGNATRAETAVFIYRLYNLLNK